ncbi:MAG TPA: hypothetical protein VGF84_16615 [Micromonosporaceae bacterium]
MRTALVIVAAALTLGACTSSGHPRPGGTTTIDPTTTETRTHHVPSPNNYRPPPASSVAPYPPSGRPPKGEKARSCPYIKAGLDSEPTSKPNIADLEGDRVGHVTVLPGYHPIGCRFYFSYSYGKFAHEAVADILPFRFRSKTAARDAMIRTARRGAEAETYKNFVKGATGIRYRTRFFGPDGRKDWAFVFAKGKVMVVVHTQQTNASLNAQAIAEAIVGKF